MIQDSSFGPKKALKTPKSRRATAKERKSHRKRANTHATTAETPRSAGDEAATGTNGAATFTGGSDGNDYMALEEILDGHECAVRELRVILSSQQDGGGAATAAAVELLSDLLAGSRRSLGDDHPATLDMMMETADMLEAVGKPSASAPLRRVIFERREAAGGLADPHTLHALATLAKLHLTLDGSLDGHPWS